MLIKLVVKIYSLNLVSAYRGYTLNVFMTQGYLAAKRLRTTEVESLTADTVSWGKTGRTFLRTLCVGHITTT